jgi:hypothetical protein
MTRTQSRRSRMTRTFAPAAGASDALRYDRPTGAVSPGSGHAALLDPGSSGELGTPGEVARFAVAAAVWSPSVHNTQPWQFWAQPGEISLYADADRRLAVTDPAGREMMISCGAALFTTRLALRFLGYVPEVSVQPDPDRPMLVARISWQEQVPAAGYEQELYGQIASRRTHRGGFDPGPLPAALLAGLRQDAARHGAMLRVVVGDGGRAASSPRPAISQRTG